MRSMFPMREHVLSLFNMISGTLARESMNGKNYAVILPTNDEFDAAENILVKSDNPQIKAVATLMRAKGETMRFTTQNPSRHGDLPGFVTFNNRDLAHVFQNAMHDCGHSTTLCEINHKGVVQSLRMQDRNGSCYNVLAVRQ